MAFLQHDTYLASGTNQLSNNWEDPVYKFDSSSFYNWEQDNLPIYDLEEREDYLFEMAGYPTSSIGGIMLTVSSSGEDNKKVFTTLSGALAVIPNTVRFPVTIEVCVSGQLGDLVLENKQIEGDGAGIEIINRGFSKVLCGSGVNSLSAIITNTEGGAVGTDGSAITIFSSTDVSNTMYESRSVGIDTTVWRSNQDAASWWNNFTRTFVQAPEWTKPTDSSKRTVTMSTNFKDSVAGTTFMSYTGIGLGPNKFQVYQYTDNSSNTDVENEVGSGLLYIDGTTQVQRPDIAPTGEIGRTTGFVYANALSKVSVKDCTGNIYIRGFCVDGADAAVMQGQRTNVGFDIQNSEVVIENCTATRCKDAGMLAANSNVTLNRGFIAYRNYQLKTVAATLDSKVFTNPTAGLKAINSNITLSATTDEFTGLPLDAPFSFNRNLIGIDLNNSNLVTPPKVRFGLNMNGEDPGTDLYGSQTIVLQSFFNNFEGIKATESLIDIGSRVSSFQNKVGMKLHNSVCRVAEITLDHNGKEGLVATGSEFNYNKNAQNISRPVGCSFYPVTNFQNNGQHVSLNSSQFIPTYVSGTGTSMDAVYSRLEFSGNHSVVTRVQGGTTGQQTVPAVELTNNSYMDAVASKSILMGGRSVENPAATTPNYKQIGAIKGSAFRVVNDSSLDLHGHQNDNTFVIGTYAWSQNQKSAALYAGNNSSIKVAGPTHIVQTGVDALAEDNSTIEFGPPTKDGIIDVSGWNLGNKDNQTRVNLHSTRACLVANRNSVINMHDMGDYHGYWNAKYLTNNDYPTGIGEYNLSAYCSSGYVQFYPNPFVDYGTAGYGDGVLKASRYPGATTGANLALNATRTFADLPSAPTTVTLLSFGGMCVRAVEDSQVNVKNVRFPAGWINCSGPTFDLSTAGGCDLLRIWNIADNSELHASYLSVGEPDTALGGYHPQDVSGYYYGPSSVWASGVSWPDYGGLSGAPSSTPDTSSLSVLDSFGLGVATSGENGFYGKTTWQNVGPFRLYVSPKPEAKFLGYPRTAEGAYSPAPNPDPSFDPQPFYSMGFEFPYNATLGAKGVPYELFAQGYATSSDCSAINNQGENYTNASAVYEELGFSGYIETLSSDRRENNPASSFFYVADMLPNDSASRIWLDESAINTFANAKNGTLGTSGRKKIFSYYKAITEYPGEGYFSTGNGPGIRSANLFDLDRDL